MRVALDASTEVGARAGRVLFAEDSVDYLGLIQPPLQAPTRRTGPAGDLASYDVIVSDGTTPATDLVARASVLGIPLVLWSDEPLLHRGPAAVPVIVGANLGSALSQALAQHPSAGIVTGDVVTIAWTEPGSPLHKGTAIAFPDPLGVMWTRERSDQRFVAYTDGEWGGAVVSVTGDAGDRVIGVADHAAHLEALTLAATALSAAYGAYEPDIQDAVNQSEQLMRKALTLELEVAVWRSFA
ncbi:MAG: hypothetical protein BMS9Abin17_0570 [Acidimicrobiia bacterium]|nr:MAG: hypothetical protein BMS9Abin17_0570 [Acidimicrobiia bacterium]